MFKFYTFKPLFDVCVVGVLVVVIDGVLYTKTWSNTILALCQSTQFWVHMKSPLNYLTSTMEAAPVPSLHLTECKDSRPRVNKCAAATTIKTLEDGNL